MSGKEYQKYNMLMTKQFNNSLSGNTFPEKISQKRKKRNEKPDNKQSR